MTAFLFVIKGGRGFPEICWRRTAVCDASFPEKCKNHIQIIAANCQLFCVSFALCLRCLLAGLFSEDKTCLKIRTCVMVLLWCYFEKI